MVDASWLPILSVAAVSAIAFHLSPALVPLAAKPESKSRARLYVGDAGFFLAGFIVMVVSAIVQGGGLASTWSLVIDLGAVAVGASLVATSKVQSWSRSIGLLIIGIHVAQALVTSSESPLNHLLSNQGSVEASVANGVAWWHIGAAAAATAVGATVAASFATSISSTSKPKNATVAAWDGLPVALGIAVTLAGVLWFDQTTKWSTLVDLSAFAAAASLVALSAPKTWPRIIGLIVLAVHATSVLATNPDAPFAQALANVHLVDGVQAGDAILDWWSVPHIVLPFLLIVYGWSAIQAAAAVIGWEGIEVAVRAADPTRSTWFAQATPWIHEFESVANITADVALGALGILAAIAIGAAGKGILGQRWPYGKARSTQ